MNEIKSIRRCYKCGMCMFQCPIYSVYRNETYSPKGKINAIDLIINNKVDLREMSEIFRECNLCNHCTIICPGEIDIKELVLKYRAQLNRVKQVDSYNEILENIQLSGNPYGFNNNKNSKFKIDKSDILLFFGCTIRYKTPDIINSVLTFLNSLDLDYTIIEDEPCCGNILYNIGYNEYAREIVNRNKAILKKFDKIVTLCPGCYNMLKSYKKLAGSKFEVFYILDIIYEARNKLKSKIKEPLYFQIPCHIYNSDYFLKNRFLDIMNIFENVYSSIDSIDATKCCGAGGGMLSYDNKYVQNRMDIILNDVNEERIMTACPLCYLNFKRHTSRDVSFITDNLDVTDKTKIELKKYSNSTVKDEYKENILVPLIKYKVGKFLKIY